MMFPPSLPEDVRARAFRAYNGELGILRSDTSAFLAACRADNVQVLGWEVWVVDHGWDAQTNEPAPAPAPGSWSGGVPVTDQELPAVITGNGDADETERQIASIDFDKEVQSAWLSHIRLNFTLDG